MKKNKMFWGMLGISTALHSLVIFGVATNGFRASSPDPENRFIPATIKVTQTETVPQENTPGEPQKEMPVEKTIEAPPKPIPVQEVAIQETEHGEEVRENQDTQENGDAGNNGESGEGEGGAGNHEEVWEWEDGTGGIGATTDNGYEAMLAYIKDFIDKNLVYPAMARRRNIEGVVGVYFEIEESGELVSVMVNHSSGSSILDNAALTLIKKITLLKNITIKKKLALNVNIDYKLTE
jgi:protein TonB